MAAMDTGYTPGEWRGKSKLHPVREYPVKALNVSTRNLLGRYLDRDSNCFSRTTGIQQDWQGLAELMGFDYSEIPNIQRKEHRTVYLLEQWSMKSGTNIGQLLKFLEDMERYDILEDDIFQRLITQDVDRYLKRQSEQERELRLVTPPVQVPEVDSQASIALDQSRDYEAIMRDEHTGSTLNDRPGHPEFFDAFLCYTHEDIVFVKQVINMLEGVHGLKLCIPDRDVTPGCAKYTVLTHIIATRCTKMVIILSRAYLQSDECDFMTKFGHALQPGARNKKLIPVLTETDCPIPDILRFITLIDFTKCELVEWFWSRLAKALQENATSMSLLFSPGILQQAIDEGQNCNWEARRNTFQRAIHADSRVSPASHGGRALDGGLSGRSHASMPHMSLTGPVSNVSTPGRTGSVDSGYPMLCSRTAPLMQASADEQLQARTGAPKKKKKSGVFF